MARLNELVRGQGGFMGEGGMSSPKPDSSAVSFKKMEENVVHASQEQQAQLTREIDLLLGRAETELATILTAVRQAQSFSLTGITQVVAELVDSLLQGDQLLVKAISGARGGLVVSNMINTAVFAIKIGIGLRYTPEDLRRLGIAAILHDVGMCLIPENIVNKPGPLTPDEVNRLKRHPELGAQALRRLGVEAEGLADIVLQEHERLNGEGYPRWLKGAEVHEHAQVIGLADTFEALLHTRPYRKRFLPHDAVRELVTKKKTAFAQGLLKCLIEQFSVFPLGTHVRLNSGETAEVVKLNPQYPLRPIVNVYLDTSRMALSEPRRLDLSRTSLVHITDVVQDDRTE